MGNGVNEDHWDVGRIGRGHEAQQDTRSAGTVKAQDQRDSRSVPEAGRPVTGIHPAQTGCLLSGAIIQKGAIIHAGVTVDQMIANRVGQDTPQASIVLACEQPMTGYHETNYSHGIQLAHFLAESGFACPERSLSVACLGQSV